MTHVLIVLFVAVAFVIVATLWLSTFETGMALFDRASRGAGMVLVWFERFKRYMGGKLTKLRFNAKYRELQKAYNDLCVEYNRIYLDNLDLRSREFTYESVTVTNTNNTKPKSKAKSKKPKSKPPTRHRR